MHACIKTQQVREELGGIRRLGVGPMDASTSLLRAQHRASRLLGGVVGSELPHLNSEPMPQGGFVSLLCTNNLPSWTAVRESPGEDSWVPPLLRRQGEGWAPSQAVHTGALFPCSHHEDQLVAVPAETEANQDRRRCNIEYPSRGLGQVCILSLVPSAHGGLG